MTSVMGNVVHAQIDCKGTVYVLSVYILILIIHFKLYYQYNVRQLYIFKCSFFYFAGEILNKLYHKIIKGEMIAETIPDVIRHTQDGITMSNKYKHCNHHQSGNRDKRKMSHDDPR